MGIAGRGTHPDPFVVDVGHDFYKIALGGGEFVHLLSVERIKHRGYVRSTRHELEVDGGGGGEEERGVQEKTKNKPNGGATFMSVKWVQFGPCKTSAIHGINETQCERAMTISCIAIFLLPPPTKYKRLLIISSYTPTPPATTSQT